MCARGRMVLYTFAQTSNPPRRKAANHLMLCAGVTVVLPHLLKNIFDHDRPDRHTLLGHLNGVPLSGKCRDAFPPGRALHIGAVVSAATLLPPAPRNAVWILGTGLVVTRVVLMAHWVSDIMADLMIGTGVERLLRFVSGVKPSRPT